MRRIRKGPAPPELERWKRDNAHLSVGWGDLPGDVKRAWRACLFTEQGHTCAYCSARVDDDPLRHHIDHLPPRSRTPRADHFDHGNVVVSCEGREGRGAETRRKGGHCGGARGNSALPVTPLDDDCEECFAYHSDGAIEAAGSLTQGQRADSTIHLLKLDDKLLTVRRREAIREALDLVQASGQALASGIEHYGRPDQQGRLPHFGFIAASVLRRMAGIAGGSPASCSLDPHGG